jgi:outer membrane protein assembly factor BamB
MPSVLLVLIPLAGSAEDWPQWRGPRQDGISAETGLSTDWPEAGPPELWRIPLGAGYSAVSVAGDRAYTMFATEEGEFVIALDAKTGKTLWKVRSGELFENSYGNGPRATPTIHEGRVYALGATGSLLCLDAATGERVWGANVLEKLGGENLEFGLSASPVVTGKMLLVVGGNDGKALAALDKGTGEVLWASLSDKGGYSTPIPVEVDGVKQIVVLTGQAVVGVAPEDGTELWRHPWKTTLDANVATPIFHDGRLFISTGYGTGCGMFKLSVTDGKPAAELLWANKNMKNYFSTCVLVDGYLYGFNNTMLTCMDFETGEATWRQRGFNRGSLFVADGRLIIFGERGTLAMAEANSEEYKELASAEILDGRTWTIPTLVDGRLYVRGEQELVCLKLK